FSLVVPVWLVWVMAGWRGALGVWPALVVCGGSFATVQFAVANFIGPELVDVLGGLVSLGCLTLFLKVWQPKEPWRFDDETTSPERERRDYSNAQIASAWVPWVLLTVLVLIWGIPPVKTFLGAATPNDKKAFGKADTAVEVRPTTVLLQVPA